MRIAYVTFKTFSNTQRVIIYSIQVLSSKVKKPQQIIIIPQISSKSKMVLFWVNVYLNKACQLHMLPLNLYETHSKLSFIAYLCCLQNFEKHAANYHYSTSINKIKDDVVLVTCIFEWIMLIAYVAFKPLRNTQQIIINSINMPSKMRNTANYHNTISINKIKDHVALDACLFICIMLFAYVAFKTLRNTPQIIINSINMLPSKLWETQQISRIP